MTDGVRNDNKRAKHMDNNNLTNSFRSVLFPSFFVTSQGQRKRRKYYDRMKEQNNQEFRK